MLSLDADEHVTPELSARIAEVVRRGGPADGYALPRKNIFWGIWVRHGGLYPDYQLRLFRRGAGRFVADAVHESVRVPGRVERLAEPLLHHSYRGLEDFVARSNRYSTLAAADWVRRGQRTAVTDLILRPLGALRLDVHCAPGVPRRLARARPGRAVRQLRVPPHGQGLGGPAGGGAGRAQHTAMTSARERVLSGMRPTGKVHLGNYLGAL